jgi:hypothetical protein
MKLDWKNPLAKHIVAATLPLPGPDLFGNPHTFGPNAYIGSGPSGRCFVTDAETENYRHVFTSNNIPDSNLSNANGLTVVCHANIGGLITVSSSDLVSSYETGADRWGWTAKAEQGDKSGFVGFTIATIADATSTISTPIGIDTTFVWTWDGTTVKYFVFNVEDGLQTDSDSIGKDATAGAPDGYTLGSTYQSSGTGWTGDVAAGSRIYGAYIMNEAISDIAATSLVRNPWQVFQVPAIIGVHKELQPEDHRLITFPSPQKQPKKVVEIDWSNPITEGLVTVFNGATPYADAVTGVSASTFNTDLAGGYQNLVGPSGESSSTLIEFNGAFDASEQFNTDATVFSLYRPHLRFTIANYGILFFSGTDINYPMLRLGWLDNGDDSVHFRVTTADNKRTNFLSANGIAPKGELGSTLGIVRGDGTNSLSGELWHNGVNVVANGALVPTTSKISLSALDDSYTVLGDNNLNDRGACSDLFLSCCWNRSLSPREAQSMMENPWQIFKDYTHVVAEEDLPDLATFEKPWTEQPL